MPAGVLGERLRRDRFFQLGVALVALVVAAALLAPWLAPFDPLAGDLRNAYLVGPGGRFLLGTDSQGRDVLSRVLYGARISLSVGLISQSVAVTLGLLLGLVAGYYGRGVDAVVMRLADVTLAFPTLLLLIAVAAAVKPSLPVVFVVIGVVGLGGDGPAGPEPGAGPQALRVRAGRPGPRRARPACPPATPVAQRADPGDHRRHARHRRVDHGGVGPLVRRARGPASDAELGRDGGRRPRPAAGGALGLVRPGIAIGLAVLGFNLVGDGLREAYDPKLQR